MRSAIIWAVLGTVAAVMAFPAAGEEASSNPKPLRAVVVTGGHAYDKEAFEALFKGIPGIEFVFQEQRDHSELFEDISG